MHDHPAHRTIVTGHGLDTRTANTIAAVNIVLHEVIEGINVANVVHRFVALANAEPPRFRRLFAFFAFVA